MFYNNSQLEYAKKKFKNRIHLVNLEIGALAIDGVVLANDLVTAI
jgi:hypothetical protein